MPPPRNTTPNRTETQTRHQIVAFKPSQQNIPIQPSNVSRRSRFITITMKQYNLLRGGLRQLVALTPESRKRDLRLILEHMDPLEHVQTDNFNEATMIPRIISITEIIKLVNYLNELLFNHNDSEKEQQHYLIKLLQTILA